MTPIINPWFIYIAGTCDEIRQIVGFLFWVGFIPCICISVIYFLSYLDDDFKNLRTANSLAFLKKFVTVTVVASLLYGLIPASKTCYQMMVASQITENNIQKAEDVIKNSVDYIFEKINEK